MDTNTEKKNSKIRSHYSHEKADARKNKRRQEAEARKSHYSSLSTAAKIALVKSRPGESKRELARLTKQLEWEKAQKVTAAAKKASMTESEKSAKAVKRAKDAAQHATHKS